METVPCRICQKPLETWPADNPEQALCEECCSETEGHLYEYVREERKRECKFCYKPIPPDWYDD